MGMLKLESSHHFSTMTVHELNSGFYLHYIYKIHVELKVISTCSRSIYCQIASDTIGVENYKNIKSLKISNELIVMLKITHA